MSYATAMLDRMGNRRLTGKARDKVDPDAQAFAEKVKKHRLSMDLTQKDFAELLSGILPGRKLHQSRVSKWETMEAYPRAWNYVALAAVTETPVRYWLMAEITDPTDPAAFDGAGSEMLDEDARFLKGIVDRYGARTVIDRFYAAATAAEATPPPVPPKAKPPGKPGRG